MSLSLHLWGWDLKDGGQKAGDDESGDVRSGKKPRKERATKERVKVFIGDIKCILYAEIYFNKFAGYLLMYNQHPNIDGDPKFQLGLYNQLL